MSNETAEDRRRPLTVEMWHKVEDALLDAIDEVEAGAERRVAELEARVRELEGAVMQFKGIWREGVGYGVGSVVIKGGSLWFATTSTADTPGEGATAWRLVVKRGAFDDAR